MNLSQAASGSDAWVSGPLNVEPGVTPPPTPKKLGHQHAAFPVPKGGVSLSFLAEMSVASAQMMASFVKLLLDQAQQQAQIRENKKKDEAAN